MKDRVGDYPPPEKGILHGYRLSFNKLSRLDNSGKANIMEMEGSVVYGIIYDINSKGLSVLQSYEGGYRIEKMQVYMLRTGETAECDVFVATEPAKCEIPPSEKYLAIIKGALKEWKFPKAYQLEVEKTAAGAMPEYLAMRIVKMVKELHRRGYTNLYLWCGMSPSGCSWRYQIGEMQDSQWPTERDLMHDSLGPESTTVDWSPNTYTVVDLADGFERTFANKITRPYTPNPYIHWFSEVADSLNYNQLLVFYADYEAEHEMLLREAPGHQRIRTGS